MPKTVGLEWNIILSGKKIMEQFLSGIKYITLILTKKIILLQISCLSLPLSISGCTLVADLSMENGKNLARFVINIKKQIAIIGTTLADGLTGKYASNVLLKNHCKQERFLLKRVGSVRTIQEKTKVYNLTIDQIPAFDTLVGVSHNTQKPVDLLKRLIEIFTDEGDVVIDPVAGSGTTLIAAEELNRKAYGFEIKKNFYKDAIKLIDEVKIKRSEIKEFGFAKTELSKTNPILF